MVMIFSELLEKEWVRNGLRMLNFNQKYHSPQDSGQLTGHNKQTFSEGTLLTLFYVMYVDDGDFPFKDRD